MFFFISSTVKASKYIYERQIWHTKVYLLTQWPFPPFYHPHFPQKKTLRLTLLISKISDPKLLPSNQHLCAFFFASASSIKIFYLYGKSIYPTVFSDSSVYFIFYFSLSPCSSCTILHYNIPLQASLVFHLQSHLPIKILTLDEKLENTLLDLIHR